MKDEEPPDIKSDDIYITAGFIIRPYRNHRGERSVRRLTTEKLYFGTTEWHPEPQWILRAFDHDKGAYRDFALSGFLEPPPVMLTPGDLDGLKGAIQHAINEAYDSGDVERYISLETKIDVMRHQLETKEDKSADV